MNDFEILKKMLERACSVNIKVFDCSADGHGYCITIPRTCVCGEDDDFDFYFDNSGKLTHTNE